MIKVLAKLEDRVVHRVLFEDAMLQLCIVAWWCAGGGWHEWNEKGKGTTLSRDGAVSASLGQGVAKCAWTVQKRRGWLLRCPCALGSVWVVRVLSKLSEESSQLLKSHMPKSSCSSKVFCLRILVQNWNLFSENAVGGRQLCWGNLYGHFLLAEACSLGQRHLLKGNSFFYFLVIPWALKVLWKFRAPESPGNFLGLRFWDYFLLFFRLGAFT